MRRQPPDRHGGQVSATAHLVAPLAQRDWVTDMCVEEIAGRGLDGSGAVSSLIGEGLRRGDVDSATTRSTPTTATGPGTRTSATATRTTTTRTTGSAAASSADETPPSFAELVQAYFDCRRHKRNTDAALAFEINLEANLRGLYEQLLDVGHVPGPSICFAITRPKPREVWAADFRDRIVHHLLYNRIAPRFQAAFIADSCACIPGRGTLYGAQRLESKVRSLTQNWSREAYYLKVDVASFFPSIDKRLLWQLLAARIGPGWWRELAHQVLFHDPRTNYRVHGRREALALIPPYKSLMAQPAHRGLPIGNLDSQCFANIYMDEVDQYAKHVLQARHYIRYVDDIVVLHPSAAWLNMARERIEEVLASRLALKLNPKKTIIQPVSRGIDFVGQVILPHRRISRRHTVETGLQRLQAASAADLPITGTSYLGMLRQATHSCGDRARFARAALRRGHCVDLALTKVLANNVGAC